MSYGITGFGAYIPRLRIERAAIAAAHAWMAPGLKGQAKGLRAFCAWDEDSITMAVEAARVCLKDRRRDNVDALWLASTTLPYADYLNAGIVAGALRLAPTISMLDVTGSQRATFGALREACIQQRDNLLLVASDRLRGKPASLQEITYGAGAAALLMGQEKVLARMIGKASLSAAFADHLRTEGHSYEFTWEERWVRDEGYAKLLPKVVAAALKDAGIALEAISHLVLPSALKGAADSFAKSQKFTGSVADAIDSACGYTGAAHGLLMLAQVLERAKPGERILVASCTQGAEAMVFEVTDEILSYTVSRPVSACLDDRIVKSAYLQLAHNEGAIDLDWGMRAEKSERVSLSAHYRAAEQTLGFVSGKCGACGTVQFPQLTYCVNPACQKPASEFEPYPLADEAARVLTFTADWLSYTQAPPLNIGFVQFDNGARILMETVDVGPSGLEIGQPLKFVFRIKDRDKTRGFNRYFWKATPVTV